MSYEFTVEEITAILLDEHQKRYDGSIPPKALNKILYFAEIELRRENVEADIPIFWYMYGTEVVTTNTDISTKKTKSGNRITCGTSIQDIPDSGKPLTSARDALSRSLEYYYEKGLEGITNEMYREAPYAVQRKYRELDKQIEIAKDEGQTTLTGDNNKSSIRSSIYDFVEAFPTEEFPEYEDDLLIWYRLINSELIGDDFDADKVSKLAKTFWRLFCLELARRENNGVSDSEIKAEHGIVGIESEKQEMREELLNRERAKSEQGNRQNKTAEKAAEAFVVPYLGKATV